MSNNLADVWHEVENLLNQNISVVPVRDKDSIYNGKLYEAKTPYREWKKYQYEIVDRAVLFQQMTDYNTTAIAMVCGAISGNLEVIDFDVKYYPGIDAIVINAINELYPDILAKMRVHKTRSGGTHLVYRIAEHEVPGSMHLAERLATAAEVEANPKGKKTRCYIETRGTGAMATAPPSLGYIVRKDIPIQTITWEERCSIVELCKAYNEYTPEEKPYKPPPSEANYYDENPFEHYNRAVDPVELFTEFGWTYVKKSGNYIWFTRPGGKRGEVHAGFNTHKHTYRVWGTKADLDSERSYTPSTILAHYRFNGDKSLTYHHLVQQGYGRIKPAKERDIARRHATNGTPLPANVSQQTVEQYAQLVEQSKLAHPHGIFWEQEEKDYIISRERLYEVAHALGFRLYNDEIVQIIDYLIHRRTESFFYDTLKEYINEENPDLLEDICNTYEAFLQKSGKFTLSRLRPLEIENILNDTRTACYKFFTNGYVLITAECYNLHSYDTIADKLIWQEKVQPRDFNINGNAGGGLYTDFLNLACDFEINRQHIMKVIGYLAHEYKDESTGYIIVLTEQCEDPEQGGGSGKNLFCQLFDQTTTYKYISGEQVQYNEKFLQSWNGERIFCISDAQEDFKFMFLKDLSTGGVLVKKLWLNDKKFDASNSPKFIVGTNYSYELKDGGLKRRIIHIEFTDFFTVKKGIKKHYEGKMFPGDWSAGDYADYDHTICKSIQLWIGNNLELENTGFTTGGWSKQFRSISGPVTADFIKENWEEFKKGNFISNPDFNKMLEDWMIENGHPIYKAKPSAFKINKALDFWCKKHNYTMKRGEIEDQPYGQGSTRRMRGRKFYENPDPPF